MSEVELLAEPSCLGTAGIDVEARTEFGGARLCVQVTADSEKFVMHVFFFFDAHITRLDSIT